MNISANGIAFIERNEGFSAIPYDDDNGHKAWGFGHDQQPGEAVPDILTRAEAETLLIADLGMRFEPTVNALIPPLCTQNQFDALCDFAYNLGCTSLDTMLLHGWDDVTAQIPRWNYVDGVVDPGLTARRKAEVDLFNS